MSEGIIEQPTGEIVQGIPIAEVVDVINQTIEQPEYADELKSALAQTAVAQGSISSAAQHNLIANHSLEPRAKIPRKNPDADRLLVLALAKQRRNKQRRL